MVVTTHYMDEVDELCDRIAVIARGQHRGDRHAGRAEGAGSAPAPRSTTSSPASPAAESEIEEGYRDAKRARRAAREHG